MCGTTPFSQNFCAKPLLFLSKTLFFFSSIKNSFSPSYDSCFFVLKKTHR
ncbi:hypothetical protein BREVNS_1120 [Brevinematales bacterium NS]|nr:hypothetical protein BREVNS_1120 [Brevinematales bacterium NS]